MFNNKYIMLALSLISIYLTLCMGTETYAKYVTSATSVTQTAIARWKILVNNDDITLGSTSTTTITPIFPGSSDISSGVLAPNAEGYFDLALDGSNVDVSFRYTITIKPNENSPVNEIVATKYVINGGDEVEFGNSNVITGNVLLSQREETVNIRVYVKWDDSLGLMNNGEDTDTTVGNQKGMLDVTINAIQI